jgi:histidinol-phosphate/aromatic aminotransferase/cobyric acid decarboxylase-like protein
MDFIDLKTQYRRIKPSVDARIAKVLEHGAYVMGPEVVELEQVLAKYIGTRHCVSVASGTDALMIALMALDIGPGDEVITAPFTFFASAEVIALVGATPVFVDIDPRTYNLDPHRSLQPRQGRVLFHRDDPHGRDHAACEPRARPARAQRIPLGRLRRGSAAGVAARTASAAMGGAGDELRG